MPEGTERLQEGQPCPLGVSQDNLPWLQGPAVSLQQHGPLGKSTSKCDAAASSTAVPPVVESEAAAGDAPVLSDGTATVTEAVSLDTCRNGASDQRATTDPTGSSVRNTVRLSGGNGSSSSSNARNEGNKRQLSLEVGEWQTLRLGPFQDSIGFEITRAWYGVKDSPNLQRDVTDLVLQAWDDKTGLQLWVSNSLFGFDPALLRHKTLCVEYRVANLLEWDVSRGTFTEGSLALTMLPCTFLKALTNLVGLTIAASGFAVGKMIVTTKQQLGVEEANVADSAVFQIAFSSWLRLNGIIPSVQYVPCPNSSCADDMRQTPIIVANHMSYIDGMVLAAVFGAPKIIAKQGTTGTPVIGLFAEEIGVIEVNREDRDSRRSAVLAIEDHVRQWRPGQRPLLLFPEGTTSNGDAILPFKKGAFVPGAPVRPVVISYTGSWHPANTSFKSNRNGNLEATGDLEWCKQFFGHLVHSLQIKVLPSYLPDELERADAEKYASNVQAVMSATYERLRTDFRQPESVKSPQKVDPEQYSRSHSRTSRRRDRGVVSAVVSSILDIA